MKPDRKKGITVTRANTSENNILFFVLLRLLYLVTL